MLKLKLRKENILDMKTNENKENRIDIIIKEKTANKIRSLPINNNYFKKSQEFYKEAANELKEIFNNELISEASLDTLSFFENAQLKLATIYVFNNCFFRNELKTKSEKYNKPLKEFKVKTLEELQKIDKLKKSYSLDLGLIENNLEDLVIKFDSISLSISNTSPIYLLFAKKSMYIASKHNERKELINDIFGSENINFKNELAAEQKYTKELNKYYKIYFDLKNS